MSKTIEEKIQSLGDNFAITDISSHTGIPTNTLYRVFRNETSLEKTRYEVIRKIEEFYEFHRETLEHPEGAVHFYNQYTHDNIWNANRKLATSTLHLNPNVQIDDLFTDKVMLFDTKPYFSFGIYQAMGLVAPLITRGLASGNTDIEGNNSSTNKDFEAIQREYLNNKIILPISLQFKIKETTDGSKRVFTYHREISVKPLNNFVPVTENQPVFSISVDESKLDDFLINEIENTFVLIDNVVQAYAKKYSYEYRNNQNYVILEKTIFEKLKNVKFSLDSLTNNFKSNYISNHADLISIDSETNNTSKNFYEFYVGTGVISERITITPAFDEKASNGDESIAKFASEILEIKDDNIVKIFPDAIEYLLEKLVHYHQRTLAYHLPTSNKEFNHYQFVVESRHFENESHIFLTLDYNSETYFRLPICSLSIDSSVKDPTVLKEQTNILKERIYVAFKVELNNLTSGQENQDSLEELYESTKGEFHFGPVNKLTLR